MGKKTITLETPIEIEMKLDKNVFNRDNFTIARVFTDTMEVQEYLNKIWKNISVKGNFPKMKPNVVYKGTVTEIEKDDKYGYSFSMANVVPRDFMSGNIKNDKDFCLFVEIFIGEGTANRLRGVKGVLKAVKNKDMDFLMRPPSRPSASPGRPRPCRTRHPERLRARQGLLPERRRNACRRQVRGGPFAVLGRSTPLARS